MQSNILGWLTVFDQEVNPNQREIVHRFLIDEGDWRRWSAEIRVEQFGREWGIEIWGFFEHGKLKNELRQIFPSYEHANAFAQAWMVAYENGILEGTRLMIIEP